MTEAADLVLLGGEVHTLADHDATHEAVAVKAGAIRSVGREHDVARLIGVDTSVLDLDGLVVLPGFVDAHTHLTTLGRYLLHVDLRDASGPETCVERLSSSVDDQAVDDWVLGFGFDESAWDGSDYLDRDDLDRVSDERPVVAFREDMHVAAVNSVVLERYGDAMPRGDVRTAGGEATGVLVEGAVDAVSRAIEPDRETTRKLLSAAQAEANRRGVTTVHDMVRRGHAPAAFRALERDGELTLRVRLNYWLDYLDGLLEVGLSTDDGAGLVRVGAVKTYTDGSLGGHTARLREPYADGAGTGQWVVEPAELFDLVDRGDGAGYQLAAHAIGDAAVDAVLDAYATTAAPADARHRVEHAELLDDRALERFADLGVVASVQPNFLKWAGPDGLYERRLGPERAASTNRFGDLLDAGVPLAFGSDGMPLDPLFGVHHAVNHPTADQRIGVTEALRAYTHGGAYAGFDEDRLGSVEAGKLADLTVLDGSPWDAPAAINEINVAITIVAGEVVYDGR